MLPSTFKQTSWKYLYPLVEMAVNNLDSADSLLSQAVEALAVYYKADCLLWTNLEPDDSELPQVYGTARALERLQQDISSIGRSPQSRRVNPAATGGTPTAVQRFQPPRLPRWLQEQQQSPRIAQLSTGDLIVPAWGDERLRFVLQLQRQPVPLPVEVGKRKKFPLSACFSPKATDRPSEDALSGWNLEDIEALEVVCSQLALALNALHWRQRLEQSRQQAALVGRIVHLLNSSLNPNEIVENIVAELGQGLNSDRCVLVDLRDNPVNILAAWDHPERGLTPLQRRRVERKLWQDIVEMFLQGAASYVELELNQSDADPLLGWLREIGAVAALIVPLFVQDEFFGAVLLLSYQKVRVYELDELQTVRQIADQAAVALTNAQHYQSLWYKQETLRLQNTSLQIEAIHDELTQLLNRRSLERELSQLSAPARWALQSPFSVIVCDIDYFKLINDSHGHLVGDEVLYSLAQRLQKQLRLGTSAYRYGGEEFVVILAEVGLMKAIEVAERLRLAIRSVPFETAAGSLEITASFGVAQQNLTEDQDAWSTVQRADKALYDAKRQGRDRVVSL